MPLAIPWLLGAAGLGAAGSLVLSDGMSKALKWAAIAGVVYVAYKGQK